MSARSTGSAAPSLTARRRVGRAIRPIRVRLADDRRRLRRAARRDVPAGAARRQHADQPGARVRSLDSRSPTTSTRRSSSSRGCRACSPARWSAPRWRCRRRVPGAAAQPAGHAVHARRLGRRVARRDARDHLRRDDQRRAALGGAAGQPRRRGDRRRHRLPAGDDAGPRDVDHGAAARRRDAELVLLGADPVRAVPRRLRAGLSRRALADGRPRRRQLRPDRGGAAAAWRSPSRCSRGCPRR